ncbi:hypothetical protein E2C01_074786 [Portunus trituberculatus]|uniref:Uncharacterized protein n=1 Tax=Portunus trituberculatus TaxID=210409 RepID=A0A5B7II49_PORTR|nr:hypothetical protein [Portunus trituberculatus]
MADQDAHEEQPRHSSSLERKQPSGDVEGCDKKKRERSMCPSWQFSASGLIEKLSDGAQAPSTSDAPVLNRYHTLSCSDEECVASGGESNYTDPLDGLNSISPAQPSLLDNEDDASFLKALNE